MALIGTIEQKAQAGGGRLEYRRHQFGVPVE